MQTSKWKVLQICKPYFKNYDAVANMSLLFQDTFFYSLVYDPSLKTLLADKGEIRVGPRYQADVPDMLVEGKYLISE